MFQEKFRYYLIVCLLTISISQISSCKRIDCKNVNKELSIAKWYIYCLHYDVKKFGYLHSIGNCSIPDMRYVSLDIKHYSEHHDTLVYGFRFIEKSSSREIIPYDYAFCHGIVIIKDTCKILAPLPFIGREDWDYKESVERYQQKVYSNSFSPILPTGQPTHFPIDSAQKRFIALIKKEGLTEDMNEELYNIYRYMQNCASLPFPFHKGITNIDHE